MGRLIVTVLLLAATAGVAQQGGFGVRRGEAHSPSLSAQEQTDDAAGALRRVAESMGRYARDVSEIPLNVESTVYKFDTDGKETHRESSSHSMKFVKRSYAEGRVIRRLDAHKKGLHWVSVDEMNGDRAAGLLALLFDNGTVSGANRYDLITHVLGKRLELKIGSGGSPCEGFDPSVKQESLRFCGETNLTLDSGTLDPVEGSFEAGGFPITFGKVRYLSFRFTESFQRVQLEGNKEPFLLAAKIVVKYKSDRGMTVIESRFSVASGVARSRDSG